MLRKWCSCLRSVSTLSASHETIIGELKSKALLYPELKCEPGMHKLMSAADIRALEGILKSENPNSSYLASIAWSLRKIQTADPHIWGTIVSALETCRESSTRDAAVTLFSLALVIERDPAVLQSGTKTQLSRFLETFASNTSNFPLLSLVDAAQLSYAITVLFPRSNLVTPFLSQATSLLNSIPRGSDGLPTISSCREICLLWSIARLRKDIANRTSRDLLEALLETNRGLRNCTDFNQNKAAQLADTLRELSLTDPRVVFQLIHFLDKNGHTVNGKNLMRITKCLGELKVDNPIAWRRIAKRIESPMGVHLPIADLETIRHYVLKLAPVGVSQRTSGIISLYIKTKTDAQLYGDNPS